MINRYEVVSFYLDSLSWPLTLTPADTGTTTIPVVTPPWITSGKKFYIIFKPSSITDRLELLCYMDWTTVKCRNIDIPSAKSYIANDAVQINDVSWLFNTAYTHIDDFWYIIDDWWLDIIVYWWWLRYWNTQTNISDTSLSLTDNDTNYIYLDTTDWSFKATVTEPTAYPIFWEVTTSWWDITSIINKWPNTFGSWNWDVLWDTSSVDNNIVTFNWTDWKTIQDSWVWIASVTTLTWIQTLTNKTISLTSNTISWTKSEFNTACSDWTFIYSWDNISLLNNDAWYVTSSWATVAFTTISCPAWTNPVATWTTDTLTLASSDSKLTITWNSATDTITFAVVEWQIDHDALTNFVANEHIDWTNTTSSIFTTWAIREWSVSYTWYAAIQTHSWNSNVTKTISIGVDWTWNAQQSLLQLMTRWDGSSASWAWINSWVFWAFWHSYSTASSQNILKLSYDSEWSETETAAFDTWWYVLLREKTERLGTIANFWALYPKSDWKLYYKKASGTEFDLTAWSSPTESLIISLSDETTDITTGTAKVTFRMPYAFTLTDVRASLTAASSSWTPTFDINEWWVSILSTVITIDANEKTSTTAATPPVISDSSLADDAEITIDIDVAGTWAKWAKIYLIGYKS